MNFLLKNGMVFDQKQHGFIKKDIALINGKIGEVLPEVHYREVIDASDCLITPGLIDYHTHCFHRFGAGINADASSFCMGITSVVDGGTTGAEQFELFYRSVINMAEVRIRSLLLMASGGQSNGRYSENLDPAYFDEEKIIELFARYPQTLVGLKTRISKDIISPEMARKSLQKTITIAEKVHTRVVVHVTDCSLPLDELAGYLRPGDVICHIYQGKGENTCLDQNGKVLKGLWEAKEQGVLFDACNGRSNFDLTVARQAITQGFVPDIISSDNNTSGYFLQPLHSLPRILSKYLEFGMPLGDILTCAITTPAALIGQPTLSSLAAGTEADVAIFKMKEKNVEYEDLAGHHLLGHHILVPQMTFKNGICEYRQADF